MSASIEDLWSNMAKSAPGAYFPRPPTKITYSFDQGVPAPETYPVEELAEYARRAILDGGAPACDYLTAPDEMTRGYLGLRKVLAERIAARDGREVTARSLMLVNGSSHGLSLIAAAFINPGDGVIVEATTFPFMVGYLRARGANIATAPLDEDGMVIDAVERQLLAFKAAGVTPKLIYTIPTFQVPTGTLMPLDRRQRLVDLAKEWNVVLVEDNCYYEKYFETPPPPTLFSLDDSGLVIQTDSFSKMMAPSLRLGYVLGVPEAMKALDGVREDLGVNQILPRLVEAYIKDGKLEPHMDFVRDVNRRKKDIALAALREHCEPLVSFQAPQGGIFFWLELAPEVDAEVVRKKTLAAGVACRPGERLAADDSGRRFLRLAFLHVSDEELARGITVLGEALRASVVTPVR